MIRRRYGWWLLGGGLIVLMSGIVGTVFLTSPTPPQEVTDVFEQLQVVMAPAEVQRIMEFPYPLDIVNGVTVKKFLGTDWCLDVYLEKGWLMKKWLVPPQGESRWRIEWLSWNARFPLLRNLPF
jgi:hypothetical protein